MQNVNYLPLKDSEKFIELLIDIKYKTPAFEEIVYMDFNSEVAQNSQQFLKWS